jgi:hypothetical protein
MFWLTWNRLEGCIVYEIEDGGWLSLGRYQRVSKAQDWKVVETASTQTDVQSKVEFHIPEDQRL